MSASADPDEYEQIAQAWLEPRLGALYRTDVTGGPEGIHDFEFDLPDGMRGAIEVTALVDQLRRQQFEAIAKHASSPLTVPGTRLAWYVTAHPNNADPQGRQPRPRTTADGHGARRPHQRQRHRWPVG